MNKRAKLNLSLILMVVQLTFCFGVKAQDASLELEIVQDCQRLQFSASENVDYVFAWQEDLQILRWFTLDDGYTYTLSLSSNEVLTFQVGLYTGAATAFVYAPIESCATASVLSLATLIDQMPER